MAKRSRNYKMTNTLTVDMGSGGGQIRLGHIDKLDAQGINGYLNNVVISAMINNYDGGDPPAGIMFYLTTDDTWSDTKVFTGKARDGAGTVSLSAKRTIRQNTDNADGNMGLVHLWAEITDVTLTDNIDVRFVIECWGRYIAFNPA